MLHVQGDLVPILDRSLLQETNRKDDQLQREKGGCKKNPSPNSYLDT